MTAYLTAHLTAHLTEDQLTDLVIEGAPAQACEPHLAACPACRERVEQELLAFNSSMVDFNRASLAWSAAQPGPARIDLARIDLARIDLARIALAVTRPFALRFLPAGLAFAALALAAVIPAWHHDLRPDPAPAVVSTRDSAREIAADNALMQSVNIELAANELSPLDEYQLTEAPGPTAKTQSAPRPR